MKKKENKRIVKEGYRIAFNNIKDSPELLRTEVGKVRYKNLAAWGNVTRDSKNKEVTSIHITFRLQIV